MSAETASLAAEILGSVGIEQDEAKLTARWRQIAVENGVQLDNTCKYSPFWVLVGKLITTPLLWLSAFVSAEVLPNMFLRYAKGAWLDAFAWSRAVDRKPSAKAVGIITLQRTDTSRAITVPLGTLIATPAINGTVYRVVTTAERTFPAFATSLEVPVEAEFAGSAWNIAGLYNNVLETKLAGLVTVVRDDEWLLVPGADAESDDDLRLRVRNRFTAVNRWHVDATYRDIISEFAGVAVDEIFFEHTAPRGPGSANALILFDGTPPAQAFFDRINQHIMDSGNHGLGDDLQVGVMYTQPIDINVTWRTRYVINDADAATLQTQIEAFIRTAFRDMTESAYSPTRVTPQQTFAWSVLVQELHNQFPALGSVDFTDDVDIDCRLWVPRINTLTLEQA